MAVWMALKPCPVRILSLGQSFSSQGSGTRKVIWFGRPVCSPNCLPNLLLMPERERKRHTDIGPSVLGAPVRAGGSSGASCPVEEEERESGRVMCAERKRERERERERARDLVRGGASPCG